MNEQDWIKLARQAREAAERSLQEEAYWLRLVADGRKATLIDTTKATVGSRKA